MQPKDYVLKASPDSRNTDCYLGFEPAPVGMDVFILGDSFMRGFYVIHSNENSLIGIVPHA